MVDGDGQAWETLPSFADVMDGPAPGDCADPVPATLAERLALAPPTDRAAILIEAVASGQRVDLPGVDLRGIDLRPRRPARGAGPAEPDLRPSPIDLDGANLERAMLSGANLSGVSLRGARLDGAVLVSANLTGADLSGASLQSANLTGAQLPRAELSFADLRGASLLTADLTHVTAIGADLREALLQSTQLHRAVLRAADLRWCRLTAANLHGADLRDARFEGALLSMANLTSARLSSATDFSLAFLHQARFDRTPVERCHVSGGVGEEHTDLSLARDAYRALAHAFETGGLPADARWAHRQASRMATATHRPDRAATFYRPGGTAFHARHALAWLLGLASDAVTGYGTCFRRIVASILVVWLGFALFFLELGGLIDATGRPVSYLDGVRYSAAALGPIEAYPLVATTDSARLAAGVEGVLGMVLLGALGYVFAARVRRE